MAKVDIRCPLCSQWDKIEISDDATKNVSKGLLAINIASGMICEHSFIAYVDKNLIVRDCLVADFKIEIPKVESTEETKKIITPETENIKFDLIRLNLPEMLLIHILRSILLGKRAIILSDQEFLFNHIKNFFKNIMADTFEFDLNIILEMDYKKNKSEYKEDLVFKNREVIRDNENIINPKGLDIEKSIVQKFFAEFDLMAGLIMLKNEIKKTYEYSRIIVELIKNNEGKSLTAKIIIINLSQKYGEKIQMPYLRFLLDIVQNYFKVEVPKIDGVSNLLGLL